MAAPLSPKETRTRQIVDAIRDLQQNASSGGVDTANSPNAGEIARFTDADTIEGLTEAEFKAAVNLEIGTDVLAQQTIGIANDNLLEVDGSPNSGEVARFTANGLEGLTEAEFKSAFNLEAGTDFYSVSGANAAFQPLDSDLTTWAGLTPSANAQSLVTAANYAAMRGLLDLEAGTDFNSKSTMASNANGAGASLVGIEDSGGLITATTVEGALAELAAASSGGGVDVQVFTTSDTWNKPGAGTMALIRLWGGGGGGGEAGSTDGGGGGGGGAYNERWIPLASLGSTESVTIGAGGTGATSAENNGTAGGQTSFGSHLTAYGGGGGAGNTASTGPGGGGGGTTSVGSVGSPTNNGGAGGNGNNGSGGSGGAGAAGSAASYPVIGGGGGGGGGTAGTTGFIGGAGFNGGGGGGGGGTGATMGSGAGSINGGGGGGGGSGTTDPGANGGTSINAGSGSDGETGGTSAAAGSDPGGGGGGTESAAAGDGGDGRVEVYVF